jgi:uncharacterized protein
VSRSPRNRPLQVPVTTILRRAGVRHPFRRDLVLPGLRVGEAAVPDDGPVVVDVVLEAVGDSLTVTGEIAAGYEAACRRCLEPTRGEVRAEVQEIFERRPTEGETYPLEGEVIDLEPMVRDALLLALPLAPLCRPDCPGPAPDSYPASVEDDGDASELAVKGQGADETGGAGDEPDDDTDRDRPIDPRWAALRDLKLD